jgi:glycosyltransferase involved in cell wall biosynthesis
MRVVHLINGLGTGGGEHLLAAVVEQLREHDHSVYCLTRLGVTAERLRRRRVVVRRLTRHGLPLPVRWAQLAHDLRRADVLHSHFFYSDLLASVVGRLFRVRRRVCTRHETGYWMRWWHRGLEPAVYAGFHRVVCVSEAVRVELRRRGVKGPMVVVHPGIEAQPSVPDRSRESTVASVGRLEQVKGHDLLLRAFAAARGLEGWRLVIVGDGNARGRLEALADSLGLGGRCDFTGECSPHEVRGLLQRSRLFVLPSRSEAFGLALLEAMAAGCACIASEVDGIPEIARHGRDVLLVAPGDVAALAAALEQLAGDRSLQRSLAIAGRDRVSCELTLERFVCRVDALYRGDGASSLS